MAIGADVIRDQRRWSSNTGSANGDSRDFTEGQTAHAALVREDEIKHCRGIFSCGELVDIRQNSD